MSITAIAGNATVFPSSTVRDVASPSNGAAIDGPPPHDGGGGIGRFASAIDDAFASVGISLDTGGASASSTDGASTTDGGDDLASFMQSLFAALHGQSAGAQQTPAGADGATTSSTDVEHAHRHGGRIEANLQSLIAQLAPSSSDTTTATAPDTSATTASTLSELETRFDALLSGSGVATDGNATLTTFLRSLAAGLHGAPATGNVVSTTA